MTYIKGEFGGGILVDEVGNETHYSPEEWRHREIMNILKNLHITLSPFSQQSLHEQLQILIHIANRFGLYDAADLLKNVLTLKE